MNVEREEIDEKGSEWDEEGAEIDINRAEMNIRRAEMDKKQYEKIMVKMNEFYERNVNGNVSFHYFMLILSRFYNTTMCDQQKKIIY